MSFCCYPGSAHKAEGTDDSGFLSLAAAHLEERYDVQHLKDNEHDTACYPAEDRNDHNDNAEYLGYLELESLSYVECNVAGFAACEERDDNAYNAEKVRSHSDYLIIGDILAVKFSGMIVLVADRLLVLLVLLILLLSRLLIGLLELLLLLLLILLILLLGLRSCLLLRLLRSRLCGSGLFGGSCCRCDRSAAGGAEGRAVRDLSAAFGTKCHSVFSPLLKSFTELSVIINIITLSIFFVNHFRR